LEGKEQRLYLGVDIRCSLREKEGALVWVNLHASDVPERILIELPNTGVVLVAALPPVVRADIRPLEDGQQVIHLGKEVYVRKPLLQLGVHHLQNQASA
jgi:hypothetical protein